MNPERWRQVETVYNAVLEHRPDERDGFLRDACRGDEDLLQEVRSLLNQQSRGLLDQPALEAAARELAADKSSTAFLGLVGETLQHYRIVEKIGQGGMGVVYRARDEHLNRDVAVKVLPPELVSDPERRKRFVQEARAASGLSHPNIITVHDISSVGGRDFIVMECVRGKTLAENIGRKGMKFSQALKYAIQITDALARAHGAGIIHRDLKPSNVMVDEHGLVKVLDFGLAKLTEAGPLGDDASTRTVEATTERGTILGTAAYMSPEQAEGKPIDTRSDIFSFGAMLYEMLTGQRAFRGDTKASTIAAILKEEPKSIRQIAEGMPHDAEKIVRRCLKKDPEHRFQTMADLRVALEELKEDSESGSLQMPVRAAARRWSWVALAGGFLALATVGVFVWWVVTRTPSAVPVPTLTRLTSDSGLTTNPALSPDGKLLAYASDGAGEGNLDIWVRQIGGIDPIRVTQDPANESEPSFSPDGTRVAFRSEKDGGGIYIVSALGGPIRKIASEGHNPTFAPDGSQIAFWSGYIGGGVALNARNKCRIFVVDATGGAPRQLRTDFVGAAYPIWTPDGKHLLFLGNSDVKSDTASIDWWVTPLDGEPAIATGILRTTNAEKLAGPFLVYPWALIPSAWAPGRNWLIFCARSGDSRNLWRISMSTENWKVAGRPERLTSSSAIEESPSVSSLADGSLRMAFASLSENTDIWSLPVETNTGRVTGEPYQVTSDTAADFHPAISPDGKQIVFVSARSGTQEIWVTDIATRASRPLTATGGNKYKPGFSPDSTKVSFARHEGGKWDIFLVPATGGAAERICEDCGQATGWSPDGHYLMGNSVPGRVFLLDSSSHRRTDLIAAAQGSWFYGGYFSPDSHWITFGDELNSRVLIAPFRGETPPEKSTWISILAELKSWSPDGSIMYGESPERDGSCCIWAQRVEPASNRPVGSPFPIFHAPGTKQIFDRVSVGRDRLVFDMAERTGNVWMVEFRP